MYLQEQVEEQCRFFGLPVISVWTRRPSAFVVLVLLLLLHLDLLVVPYVLGFTLAPWSVDNETLNRILLDKICKLFKDKKSLFFL